MPHSLPPAPAAQRGTALIAAGVLLTFTTAHSLAYRHWVTYGPPVLGLVLCYTGVYLSLRKSRG